MSCLPATAARARRAAALGCVALAAASCAPDTALDPWAERCLAAARQRDALEGEVAVVATRQRETGRSVTLQVQPEGAEGAAVTCRYALGERFRLDDLRIEGESFSEAELALVNAELLLEDLQVSSGPR